MRSRLIAGRCALITPGTGTCCVGLLALVHGAGTSEEATQSLEAHVFALV